MITETRKQYQAQSIGIMNRRKACFVPTGEVPGFEVTVNPESMIADKGFATGGYLTKDTLAIGEQVQSLS